MQLGTVTSDLVEYFISELIIIYSPENAESLGIAYTTGMVLYVEKNIAKYRGVIEDQLKANAGDTDAGIRRGRSLLVKHCFQPYSVEVLANHCASVQTHQNPSSKL